MRHFDELFVRFPALRACEGGILAAYGILRDCFSRGGSLLLAGNGGSCADCAHIAGELLKGFVLPRKIGGELAKSIRAIDSECAEFLAENLQGALPAISLPQNSALTSAVANDTDASLVFAQQIMGLGRAGDAFLAISTSGNAKNLYLAAVAAKAKGLKTVALTGGTGGALKKICDAAIVAPERETRKIQELHLPIYHAVCLQLEEDFFGE